MQEWTVDVGSGVIAGIDYGTPRTRPDAVPVVLVHSLGTCCVSWHDVAATLGPDVHAYAVDLPGHGRSTAEMTSWTDAWAHLSTVTRELGLDRPLLVAHDQSTYLSAVALRHDPTLYRGLVALGGTLMLDPEGGHEAQAFVLSDGFAPMLVERFRFGEIGVGEDAARALVEDMVARSERDWLLAALQAGLRREVERSIERRPDGTWRHKPPVEAVQRPFEVPPQSPDFPGPHFYDPLTVPLWLVRLGEGYEALTDEQLAQVQAHPWLRTTFLESGAWPQYERPGEVAALIDRLAADPDADLPQ